MLWPSLFNRGTFYIFIALLPAALAGRRGVPAPLWAAGCFAALAALALGAWSLSDATKTNAARPLFSAIGPVLAIAAAAWLAGNPLRHSRDVAVRR